MDKSTRPVIPSEVHNRQNLTESTPGLYLT
jgi:hypothetical protein